MNETVPVVVMAVVISAAVAAVPAVAVEQMGTLDGSVIKFI
jgi:hypothetical protein